MTSSFRKNWDVTSRWEKDPSKLNIWGSSLAYGHPFAATGGRMIITLLQALEATNGKYGLATACAGWTGGNDCRARLNCSIEIDRILENI